jgi:hypothetical protein
MKPIVELQKYKENSDELLLHIKIYSDGRIEGFDGVIINRIPDVMIKLCETIGDAVMSFGNDIKSTYTEAMK